MTVEINADKVESLASQGLTMEQIASCLGCATSTLYLRMGSESEVSEAIKRGRAKGVATVANALFQSAKGGNTTAQIFYLKNRDPREWRDRRELEHSGPDGGAIKVNWEVLPVTTLDKVDETNPED